MAFVQSDIRPPVTQPGSMGVGTGEASSPAGAEVAFGPILLWSVLATTLLAFVGTGGALWWLTGEVWDGIGLGAFCAFWGGPGFGLMVAGARWTVRMEKL